MPYYADAAPDGGLDAAERESLLHVLGKHFTGQPWPRAVGVDTIRHFMADLQPVMITAGWAIHLFSMA
jgi:hypothetical protein